MIKIKRINTDLFLKKLYDSAYEYRDTLKIFGKNYYPDFGKGVCFKRQNNKLIMYYETGRKNKFNTISTNKSFLIGWCINVFKKDYLISFLVVRPTIILLLLSSVIILFLCRMASAQEIIANLMIFLIGIYALSFSQCINLLNFIDEISIITDK